MKRIALLQVLQTAAALNAVVLGPGDPWLNLAAAKVAHGKGLPSAVASNKPDIANQQMWGREPASTPVRVVDGAEEIGEVLADAEGVVLNGAGFGKLTPNYCEIVVRNSPKLARLTLCVEAGQAADAVTAARGACATRSIPCDVIRVGALRGGGPGAEDDEGDVGLSKFFYDTNADYPKYQMDSYADKFLLGLSATPGDKPVNFFKKALASQSMGPSEGVSNRGTCARALVAAVSREAGAPELDLTLNAEEGMRAALLDDADAWGTFFSDGSASGAKVTGPLE